MVDFDPSSWSEAVANLRSLASQGRLADVARSAPAPERKQLAGAAFTLAWPIVFNRITRAHEQRRGHRSCAVAVDRLADGCLDRFYDDVEAVVDDLLTHSTTKIANAEGWITSRLRAVTIDAHRRRRGARGALQRPRLPGWLVQRLPGDAWLVQLAVEILVWVGVPATAGTQLWPLDNWAERRGVVTGDRHGSDARTVQREVDRILVEMRWRPQWYADHVERPLGRKTPPLAPTFVDHGSVAEPPALVLTGPDENAEARLADLASVALVAIEEQLALDPRDEAAIGRIIATVFGRIDTSGDLVQLPDPLDGRSVGALVDDPDELHRIVQVIREIVADGLVVAA
ncbi:MAG TPA: hypothetical protein VFC00_21060 [Micromonosporaceae bacterium]|nr:hypothetical protein [Micromonosporaceae bacterium]